MRQHDNSTIEEIKIYCSNLEKKVTIKYPDYHFEASESGYDTYGDGGSPKPYIYISKCKCNKTHSFFV